MIKDPVKDLVPDFGASPVVGYFMQEAWTNGLKPKYKIGKVFEKDEAWE